MPDIHEKPMTDVFFDVYDLTGDFARWEEKEQYLHETVYGFDPDYDPMPMDMEVENTNTTATLEDDDDIPF